MERLYSIMSCGVTGMENGEIQALRKAIESAVPNSYKKPLLFVLKGFPKNLDDLPAHKALDFPIGISIRDLHEARPRLLPLLLNYLMSSRDVKLWCTFEEYMAISPEIWSMYVDVKILKNNLYHNVFPASYEIPNADELCQRYFDENVVEQFVSDPDLEIVQLYYGNVRKVGSRFYVSYALDTDEENVFPSEGHLPSEEHSVYDGVTVELTEDEESLLALIEDIRDGMYNGKSVRVSLSGPLDMLPNRYPERLAAMAIAFPAVSIVLCTRKMVQKPVTDDSAYRNILKEHWGYDSFRNLRMYANVNGGQDKNRTIYVSQSQIIHDIVQQAERAMSGEPFQDVFVTSSTGAGKSIMFQIPAIYLAKKYNLMTIVISPLIGLMVDQVQGLQSRNIDTSATINSEITPFQKADIMEGIASGKISILYISPETLLSRSDITQLIGNRQIGLFVIDEAHIVTTWGKAFRSDYWYLGTYLQRLRKEMKFPIATFTATAIYGGIEDMYSETRDSLNMINPISYFGYVKRDDLHMKINRKLDYKEATKLHDYLQDKFNILLTRLEAFVQLRQKTLVYFPLVTLIQRFLSYTQTFGSTELRETLSYYYGSLDKEQKATNYLRFKNNESLIMLATKAFGMGIDIPDILNVYHFAPTGNVCDYIQEIGRAARALQKGYAYSDYLPKDFVHVNRLHGISTLQKRQLVQVIEKILRVVESNGTPRNILISPDEFRHIFEKHQGDDEDVDNKLKTALLIIEKDFKAKLGYSPIVARPRSLFATEYFLVRNDVEESLKASPQGQFFRLIDRRSRSNNIYSATYACDLKGLWESQYRTLSFPQFKYKFHAADNSLKISFLTGIQPVLKVVMDLATTHFDALRTDLAHKIGLFSSIFGEYARNNKYFSIDDVAEHLQDHFKMNWYSRQGLASLIVTSADRYDQFLKRHSNFYTRFLKYDEVKNRYQITSGFSGFIEWVIGETNRLFNRSIIRVSDTQYEYYMPRRNRGDVEKTFILLGILEALRLIMYRVHGGDYPEIFIRINSLMHLQRVVKDPGRYENFILNNVYQRHRTSVAMLTYLFENPFTTEEYWDIIENYFLGDLPLAVTASLSES